MSGKRLVFMLLTLLMLGLVSCAGNRNLASSKPAVSAVSGSSSAAPASSGSSSGSIYASATSSASLAASASSSLASSNLAEHLPSKT